MKVIDDVVYEFQGKTITIDDSGIDIGANPSEDAEAGAEEAVDSTVQRVINIVHSHKLAETGYDKKSFLGWLKNYLKKVKEVLEKENPDRVQPFMTKAQEFVKSKLLPNFNDLTFYTGESMDPEAAMMFAFYEGESTDPSFWVFKDGLKETKF